MKCAVGLLMFLVTACPRQKAGVDCAAITSEFIVVGVRAQEPGWGEPCVPLNVGDTFQWTQHGACRDRVTARDVPTFATRVAPVCSQPGPFVCTTDEGDGGANEGTRILIGNTNEGDLIVEWRQVTDSGEVIECTQHFDVDLVGTFSDPG